MLIITAQSEIVAIEDIQHIYDMIKPNMLHIHIERSSNESLLINNVQRMSNCMEYRTTRYLLHLKH